MATIYYNKMRIVVVLQVLQKNAHPNSIELVQELCRRKGEHEVILALDGLFTNTIEPLRAAFNGILPRENIRLWYTQPEFVKHNTPVDACQEEISTMVLQAFLASLKPDIVLLTGAIERLLEGKTSISSFEIVTYSFPIVLLLPSHPFDTFIKIILQLDKNNKPPLFFLTSDGLARREWLRKLTIDEGRVVALDEKGESSLECQVVNALSVLEAWYEQSTALSVALELPQRQNLAYVSPLPPQRSGISDYSSDLLPELSRYYNIEVIVEQDEISDRWIRDNCQVRTAAWLREHADDYDHVLYHIGNSHFHNYMFDLLNEVPGIVVLHDFFLSNFLAHRDYSEIPRDSFASLLYRSHGYKALVQLSSPTGLSDVEETYPCNFDVLRCAEGVIVHSRYARKLSSLWYSNNDSLQYEVIPLLRVPSPTHTRAEARHKLGLADDDIVVCSFGMPTPYKLSHRLLESWLASSLVNNKRCSLFFVGEATEQGYCKTLRESIEQSGYGERIHMTGWLTKDEYSLYIAAADIGVQLRTLSRGETSAAVLDCLNYGVATLVNANGSMEELPEDCVLKLKDQFTPSELTKTLEYLVDNASIRKKLGETARNFTHTFHSPHRVAEQYRAALERFSSSPQKIRNSVLRSIGRHDSTLSGQANLADSFPVPLPARQLFIDVSELVLKDLKTGIQRVVRSVLMELLEHPPKGYRIEPVYVETDEQGFHCRYARQFSLNLFSISIPSPHLFTDEEVEIHSGDIYLALDLCYTMRHSKKFFEKFRNTGGQLYFVIYDLLPCFFPQYFHPGIDREHNEWMEIAAQSDGVLCISRSVADDVKEWFDKAQPLRYRPFKIGWFHLGADIENSMPTRGFLEGFDKTVEKLSKSPTILMVGTVEPRKGYLQVVKACELLWMSGMKVNLVIVGKKGWLVEKFENRLIRHKQLNKQLFWYQAISDEALQKLYEAADGLVMASEGEGFGLPLIEAAQHDCPILARDLPVFREVAGEHASYFSGNSPLQLAIALKQWIGKLKKGVARQSSGMPCLTWKECAVQIVNLLSDDKDSQWVYRWKPDTTSKQKINSVEHRFVKKSLKCIAVDLTLVLAGGENGGAKVFLLELLLMLARMQPKTRFILLTRESSHNELAMLDRPNIERVMVVADLPPATVANDKQTEKNAGMIQNIFSWWKRTVKRWKRSLKKRIHRKNQGMPNANKTLREMGVELLYCPFTSLDYAEADIPAVCTVHDLQYKTYPEFFTDEEVALRDRWFIDTCERSTMLVAISEYSRISALYHGDFNPDKIRTIYHRMAHRICSGNGQDKEEDNMVLNRLDLERDHYFLYPANFWVHKNHEVLLTAFELAIAHGLALNMKLVCTGAPTERQRFLIGMVSSMGLAERVIFPGYLPNNELAVVLSNSAGLIFPSLYEGFGLPVIEAMAAGIPVACSNTRALPEITSDAALLFNPDNPEEIAQAMVSLTRDESLRARLIEAGLLRAQEFSDRERMAREYWNLFEEAINPMPELSRGRWSVM